MSGWLTERWSTPTTWPDRSVDGQPLVAKAYGAAGLWGDGSSVALEEFDVPSGQHEITIDLGDTADEREFAWHDAHVFELKVGERHTVLFNRTGGFSWH